MKIQVDPTKKWISYWRFYIKSYAKICKFSSVGAMKVFR